MAGNVVWTVHGTVWALYRVQGVDQVHSSKTAKLRRLKALEALVKKLVGESMWLSLCPQVDPRAVVRAMTEDIDMQASDHYTQVAHRVLDTLEGLELTGRTDWLAVPLPAVGRRQRLADMASATKAEVALQLGLLPAPISRKEEGRRLAQAAQMAATWPGTVAIRPASEAEILWIYGHSARRGVLEPLLPAPDAGRGIVNRGRTVAALGQAVLTEGAIDGVLAEEVERRGAGVFRRRWLGRHRTRRLLPVVLDALRDAGGVPLPRLGVPGRARYLRLPCGLGGAPERHARGGRGGQDPAQGPRPGGPARGVGTRSGRGAGLDREGRGQPGGEPGAADRVQG
ncbi:hypothetical protein ACFWN5_37580 [Streptomyces sp. NPDC058430]|uniref:hypothetical protein n=1 Tax=Streptomyces sp. NPDC058430 TaxID=3346495 RepID=UPI003669C76F